MSHQPTPSAAPTPGEATPPTGGGSYLFDPETGQYTALQQPAPAAADLRRDASEAAPASRAPTAPAAETPDLEA